MHLARLIPTALLALAVAGCGPNGTSATPTSSGAPSTARISPGAQQGPAPVLEAGLPFTRDGLTVTVAEPATATFRAGGRVVQLTVQVTAVNTSGAAVALPAEFGLVCRNSPNTNSVKNVSEAFPDSTVKPGALVPAGQTTTGALVVRWVADAANPTQLTTCRGGGSIVARAPGAGDLASWIVPPDVIRTGNALVDQGGTLA